MAYSIDSTPFVEKSGTLRYIRDVDTSNSKSQNISSALYFNTSIASSALATAMTPLVSLISGIEDSDGTAVLVTEKSTYTIIESE